LIIVAWATFNAYLGVVEDLVIERDRELTSLIASELEREIGPYIEVLGAPRRIEERGDAVTRNVIVDQVGSIVKPRIGRGGHAYLVDEKGIVLYHSDISRFNLDVSSDPVVQMALSGETGALRTYDTQGQEIVASFAPVGDVGYGIITEESWQDLIQSSLGYRRLLLFLLVLGVIAPSVVIAIGARRITRPITALTGAAQELAGGNFAQTITVDTRDELEDLAEQFNRMAAQLQESYQNLERKVADRTQELATLNAIAASVNESLDLDRTLNRTLDELLGVLDLEVGEIRLLDRERKDLVIRTQRGLSSQFIQRTDRLAISETLPGRVLASGEPIICEDLNHETVHTWAADEGLQAMIICPLQARDEPLGTLSLGTRRGPRRFGRNDRELLRAVSDQVGVAIENAQLFETEQRRAEQLQLINTVGQRIVSILSVNALLEEIVRLVQKNLGYYLVGIGLLEGNEVVISTGAGDLWEMREFEPVRLQVGQEGVIGWVAESGEPLVVPDVTKEPRYFEMPGAELTRSEVVLPLKYKGEIVGVLDVQSERLNAFDKDDLAVLEALARQAAIAIENARLYQQAQQLAVMEERTRLARDLHDSVTQSIYGVTLFAEAAGRLLAAGDTALVREHLQDLQQTAQEALQEMRLLIFELRPSVLGENGLVAALQARLEAVEGRAGLETALDVDGQDLRLAPQIEEGLYRIAQEALNNALKHAQARRISIHLCQNQPTVVLKVSDDGVGFDRSSAHQRGGLGLRGMEERAVQLGARLTIDSQPGSGTHITVEVDQ
jgi:nitrate/nitrite-specific signal transduction histidine kinase